MDDNMNNSIVKVNALFIFCILIVIIFSSMIVYRYIESTSNDELNVEPILERYNGDYIITFIFPNGGWITTTTEYSLEYVNGTKVLSERIRFIYCKDSRFLNEDFTSNDILISHYDIDGNMVLSNNDTFFIKSNENGGVAKPGMKLCFYFRDKKILEITLMDNVPERNIPPFGKQFSNTFIIDESTIPTDSNLTISQEHIAFSSIRGVSSQELGIGITLINTSPKLIENVSLKIYYNCISYNNEYRTILINDITNITFNENSMRRFVSYEHFSFGEINIFVEIKEKEWNDPLVASANIQITAHVDD